MTHDEQTIQKIVIKEFTDKDVQKTYEDMTRSGLWKSEEKLFSKYFRKKSKVLDIGCGSGRTTFQLEKRGYKVVGIDLTPAMIKTAKKLSLEFKKDIEFRVGNALNLAFDDESFDNALFSFNGWNQIPMEKNRLLALKEAYRVIKPKGYFIFTSHIRQPIDRYIFIWAKEWVKIRLLKPRGFKIMEIELGDRFFKRGSEEVFRNKQFIHLPTLSKIKEQIKDAGFEIVFYDRRNSISEEDERLKSGNCMMFVCRKV